MKLFLSVAFVCAALLCLCDACTGEEWLILGPRALGMGGAGVAVIDDANAAHWNPAAFGFKTETVDVELQFGFDAGVEGNVIENADAVFDKVENTDGTNSYTLDNALDILSTDTGAVAADAGVVASLANKQNALQTVLDVLDSVPDLDQAGEGAVGSIYGGLALKYASFGFSATSVLMGSLDPFVDLADSSGWNLDTGEGSATAQLNEVFGVAAGSSLAADVGDAAAQSWTARPQTVSDLGDTLNTMLQTAAFGLNAADAEATVEEAFTQADAANFDLTDSTNQQMLTNLLEGTAGTGKPAPKPSGGTAGAGSSKIADVDDSVFEDNAGVIIKAVQIYEYNFSYGRALLDDRLSLGVNLKMLQGETRYIRVSMEDLEDGSDLADEMLTGDENANSSTQFDMDLGVLYKPLEKLTLGLVGKHLVSPEFDFEGTGAGVSAVQLEPQVRFGVAYEPLRSLTIAADADLTTNDSEILDGYESRQVCLGVEWRPFKPLGVRVGAYDNVASSDTDWIYTAGLGFRFFKFAFDVSGSMTTDEVNLETADAGGGGESDIPARASVAALLSFNSSF